MGLLRNLLLSRRFHSLLNPKNPHTLHSTTPHSPKFKIPHRPISSLPHTQDPVPPKPQKEQNKKLLSALFIKQVPQKAERKSLHAAFTNKPVTANSVRNQNVKKKLREPVVVFKELSPDMVMFVNYLYKKGYFKDADFAKGKESFDLAWFETIFARGYIKFAAHRFATDNQQIAKCLSSGSALKQVAVFGCPSTNRKNTTRSKRLRKFLGVLEDTACRKCMLRKSCKFMNRSVNCDDTTDSDFAIIMQVITSYDLGLVHPRLVVPDEVNKSISDLLKEVVKLSQTS